MSAENIPTDTVNLPESPVEKMIHICEEDLKLVAQLAMSVKNAFNGKHPALINIFNYLVGLK